MAGHPRAHHRRLSVSIKIRPAHRHDDLASASHLIGHPRGEQGPHLNAGIRQQAVDLPDRVLRELGARPCASPWPIAWPPKAARVMTPNVALAREYTRFARRSSPKSDAKN